MCHRNEEVCKVLNRRCQRDNSRNASQYIPICILFGHRSICASIPCDCISIPNDLWGWVQQKTSNLKDGCVCIHRSSATMSNSWHSVYNEPTEMKVWNARTLRMCEIGFEVEMSRTCTKEEISSSYHVFQPISKLLTEMVRQEDHVVPVWFSRVLSAAARGLEQAFRHVFLPYSS